MRKSEFINGYCNQSFGNLFTNSINLYKIAELLGILNKDNSFSIPYIENRFKCEIKKSEYQPDVYGVKLIKGYI